MTDPKAPQAPDQTPASPAPRPSKRRVIVLGSVLVGVLIGYVVVARIDDLWRGKPGDPTCFPAVETAKRLEPLARGEVAGLTMAKTPLKLPDLEFKDAEGQPTKLSNWRGRTVLLNLWATWCVPCRKEMPALNELEQKLGGSDFQVVAINIDTRDAEKPKTFLKDGNLTRLDYFTDASAKVFQELKGVGRALGMPTSVLIDGKGCEIATIAGPAEWASEDAVKLIKAAVKPKAAGY
ncbi:TlpA family protein disulfide reductase [Rhodopseudomonas boonkerdii]|uniref:thiol:disulfide interchange protein TlpA n=1 Tax=Rhodopseudomonas boonkerdii TaxID=475937 RepID=UPI001E3A2CAF|nr:TlpA disulfide reductase family protein [Rhodopseudomonas boonkerdii]UGV28363.1 TlpA family protein disulfide reductase [Rhodopseudomonas boonkerdii]